jgi:hypothetical protein
MQPARSSDMEATPSAGGAGAVAPSRGRRAAPR